MKWNFFETSEEVVIYMKKKKRLEFLRTQGDPLAFVKERVDPC